MDIFKILLSLVEPTLVVVLSIILFIVNSWLFKKMKFTSSVSNITRGTISFTIALIGVLVFILALPIDSSLKGQILGFLGIIFSAGIALSSTTVLGNLIAGVMNNSMKRFRNGDLIQIGEFYGKVVNKGIFHTEIQLDDSNFSTIPNLYIASNPVKLIRKSDTVISTSVSLGYDISREKVQQALEEAAILAGLSNPYVYITSLGDFSVVYKIHGFLEDSNTFFSTKSLLNAKVMDVLHAQKIEIVSPSFMNQRRVDDEKIIPKETIQQVPVVDEKSPEELIFDKAIKSEKIELKKDHLKEIDANKQVLSDKLKDLTDADEVEKIKSAIKRYEVLRERLEKSIKAQLERDKK